MLAEVLVFSKLDKKLFGTWLTPFTILATPYASVTTIAVFFSQALGFVPFYIESVLVWIAGLALFWAGGALMIAIPLGKKIRGMIKTRSAPKYESRIARTILISIAWLCIFASVYGFLVAVTAVAGIWRIGTQDFGDVYGTGWYAHLRVFSVPLLIFFVGTVRRRQILIKLTIFGIILSILASQVKYAVILPITAGLIYRYMSGRLEITIRKAFVYFGLVYITFNMAYLIGFGAKSSNTILTFSTYKYLLTHFFSYLFSGVLAFGEEMRRGIAECAMWTKLFGPVINLIAVITTGKISTLAQGGGYEKILIGLSGETSNVRTLFGTLLIRLSYYGGAVFALSLGLLSYILFATAMLTRNCWIIVVYLYIITGLGFGFFGYYFGLLSFYEVAVYGTLLALFVRFHIPGKSSSSFQGVPLFVPKV